MSSNSEFNETAKEPSPEAHRLFHRVRNGILAQNCPEHLSYEFIEPEIGFQVALALDEDGSIESEYVRIDYNSLTRQLTVTSASILHGCYLDWISKELTFALTSGFFTVDGFKHLELSAITSMPYLS